MPVKKAESEGPVVDNMRFYNQVRNTPETAQKTFNNGRFTGTDINPMWRISKLTEIFGPAGIGWWTEDEVFSLVPCDATGEIAIFCTLHLIVVDPETKEKSQPIFGAGGNKFLVSQKSGKYCNDEAYKMAYTDALSIACKALGFSHDIYYSKDRTKYTMNEDEQGDENEEIRTLIGRIQKGIATVTKGMEREQRDNFINPVITKHIGDLNFMVCKDTKKLKALLDELIAIASKEA